MARVAFVVFFGKPRNSEEAHESPWLITAPLALLAIGSVLACVLVFDWPGTYDGFGAFLLADQEFLHHVEKFHIVPWLAGVSTLLAVGGVALGWLIYIRGSISHEALARRLAPVYRAMVKKYYVDDAYQWTVDRIVLAFSSAVAAFDRIVVNDTGVDGPALLVRLLGFPSPVRADGAALQLRVGDGDGHLGACGLVVDADGVVFRGGHPRSYHYLLPCEPRPYPIRSGDCPGLLPLTCPSKSYEFRRGMIWHHAGPSLDTEPSCTPHWSSAGLGMH